MSVNLNGDDSQWTLGTLFLAVASGQMISDSKRFHHSGGAGHTARRSADVPPLTVCGRVIPYSLEIEVTTADASVASGDVTAITYRGEGSEWAELDQFATEQRIWVKTNCPGTYHLTLSNGPETLYCSQPFTVSFADLWTPVTIQMPPNVGTLGTDWWVDNRVGYTVAVTLCAGTGVQGALGAWTSGVKFGGTQQTNFNATVGNLFKIAGLRVGRADDMGPDFYELPETVERACMRYLEGSMARSTTPAGGIGAGTGHLTWTAVKAGANVSYAQHHSYRVAKRKSASLSFYNPALGNIQARDLTAGADCTASAADNTNEFGFRAFATTPAGTAIGNQIGVHWMASAALPALGVSVGS